MNHSRVRPGIVDSILGLLGDGELTPKQESSIKTIRAREISAQNALRGRMQAYKTQISGLRRSLGLIDADIAGVRAQLAVERRPQVRSQLQTQLKQEEMKRNTVISQSNKLKSQAVRDQQDMQRQADRMRRANVMEAARVRRAEPAVANPISHLNMDDVVQSLGRLTEISSEVEGGYDAMSWLGVTAEHEGDIPTNNLTPQDMPYYMQRKDSEFETGVEHLLKRFQVLTLRRKHLIQTYYNTGDTKIKAAIEANEGKYKAIRMQVEEMKGIQQSSMRTSTNLTHERDIPGYVPIPAQEYPLDIISRSQPTNANERLPEMSRPKLPFKDQGLRDYIPALQELVKACNALAMEYEAAKPTLSKPRGFNEVDTNEQYVPDAGVFQQYTTVGEARKRPTAYRKGVLPEQAPKPKPSNLSPGGEVTLNGLLVRNSGDLISHGVGGIMGDEVEEVSEIGQVPIYEIQPVKVVSREREVKRHLAAKRIMEG